MALTGGQFHSIETRSIKSCFRFGPLNALSLVGTKQEECGDYFEVNLKI